MGHGDALRMMTNLINNSKIVAVRVPYNVASIFDGSLSVVSVRLWNVGFTHVVIFIFRALIRHLILIDSLLLQSLKDFTTELVLPISPELFT